jgi:hypothetical protein
LAKPHGRVDMLLCVMRAVLAIAAALTAGGTLAPVVLVAACVALALLQLYVVMVYQQFFSLPCNQYQGAGAAVLAWASLCTLLAHVRGRPEDQVESFCFLLTLVRVHCVRVHCVRVHCVRVHCVREHCVREHCVHEHCVREHCVHEHCVRVHCVRVHCVRVHCAGACVFPAVDMQVHPMRPC